MSLRDSAWHLSEYGSEMGANGRSEVRSDEVTVGARGFPTSQDIRH